MLIMPGDSNFTFRMNLNDGGYVEQYDHLLLLLLLVKFTLLVMFLEIAMVLTQFSVLFVYFMDSKINVINTQCFDKVANSIVG